jgi:hypothetical protein
MRPLLSILFGFAVLSFSLSMNIASTGEYLRVISLSRRETARTMDLLTAASSTVSLRRDNKDVLPVCHFQASISVNGQQFTVIADSGSSDLALPMQQATGTATSNRLPTPLASSVMPCSQSSQYGCLNGLSQAQIQSRFCSDSSNPTGCASRLYSQMYDIPTYFPSCASTFNVPNSCGVSASYGVSGSAQTGWKGIVLNGSVAISDLTNTVIFSGVGAVLGGGFVPSDGILGLAFPALSVMNSPSPVFSLLQAAGRPLTLSICVGAQGGSMFLSSPPASALADNAVAVTFSVVQYNIGPTSQNLYYDVFVNSMTIGSNDTLTVFKSPSPHSHPTDSVSLIDSSGLATVFTIDTGSPEMFLSYDLFQSVLAYFSARFCTAIAVRNGFYQCTPINFAADPPPITFQIQDVNGIVQSVPLFQYVYKFQSNWFFLFTSSQGNTRNIFGVPFIQVSKGSLELRLTPAPLRVIQSRSPNSNPRSSPFRLPQARQCAASVCSFNAFVELSGFDPAVFAPVGNLTYIAPPPEPSLLSNPTLIVQMSPSRRCGIFGLELRSLPFYSSPSRASSCRRRLVAGET